MLTQSGFQDGVHRLSLVVAALFAAWALACAGCRERPAPLTATEPIAQGAPPSSDQEQEYARRRATMIAEHLAARDITDKRVLAAMERVPRHEFVPPRQRHRAYVDAPMSIGHGQTISQPYIVALMTQLAEPRADAKALDIGTGSGYQAAVLAELVKNVYSIEIVEPLAADARRRLQSLGYKNIQVRHGDGYLGWPEEAPFDVIIVAAAPDHIPAALIEQLAPGGKMLIPVGQGAQDLLIVEKGEDGAVTQQRAAPVAFVPMTGEAQR